MSERIDHEKDTRILEKSNITYRPELDGLRAIAILAVMFYHAGFGAFQGGFVGVDVFFVLSGYLMTSIITRESEKNEFTLLKFYERRARRILPMLYFTIIASYYLAYKYLVNKEYVDFTKSAFFASIGLSNFYFAQTTKGYFDTATELIPLLHTWTLGVEEQFYVIIPLLFWRFGRNMAFIMLILLSSISFGLALAVINPIGNFYMLYTRFWELAIGSLIVFLPKQKELDVFSLVGLGAIFTAIFAFKESMPDPSCFTLLPTLGTALFIIYTKSETIIGRIMSFKPLVWIGLISYSAYLIHQPLFVFSRLQTMSLKIENLFTNIGIIVLTLCISYLTWRFVENPFRAKAKIQIKPFFSASIFYFFLIGLVLLKSLAEEKDFFNLPIKLEAEEAFMQTNFTFTNSTKTYTVVPSERLFDRNQLKPIGMNCHAYYVLASANAETRFCRLTRFNKSSSLEPPAYFLYGDSMSLSLVAAFASHFNHTPGMFAAVAGTLCHSLLVPNNHTDKYVMLKGYPCQKLNQAVYEYIKSTASISTLYMASSWNIFLDETREHFEYTLDAYAALNVQIYIIQQPPVQKYESRHVYYYHLHRKNLSDASIRENSLTRKEYAQQQAEVEKEFAKYKSRRGVKFIYIENLVCDNEYCPIGTAQVPFFADKVHLTTTMANSIKPALLRQATYGTLKLGIYQYLKKWVSRGQASPFYANIVCAVVAGATSNALANPTDVLKVRMQAQAHTGNKKSLVGLFVEIYQHEGVKGLYRLSASASGWARNVVLENRNGGIVKFALAPRILGGTRCILS